MKTYFVPMVEEQRARYEDYRIPAARLIATAQAPSADAAGIRPPADAARLHADDLRHAGDPRSDLPRQPEARGAGRYPDDLLAEPERKIIVFSEWERMLELVRELAAELGVETAWHTGSVPQQRRRAEIIRFKQDPACRLFLSTDSGSVGLNLQAASAVVNVDLPWNPAKLEQRIARAWRKNQTRSVTVVNLVCENSIEHQILHLHRAQAGAGRRRARRAGRSRRAQDAVRPRRDDRAHAGDDAGTGADPVAGRACRRRAAGAPRRARAADRGAHRPRWTGTLARRARP